MDPLELRIAALERMVDRLQRRIGVHFAPGRLTLGVDDTGVIQLAQVQLDALSLRHDVPVLYNYGFTSNPPLQADMHVCFMDGDRTKAAVIASNHQKYRLANLGLGDSALYDVRGANFWLAAAGPMVTCAGNPMTVNGDLHVTGAVIAGYGGSDQVGLQTHKHGEGIPAASGTSAPTAGT